MTFPANEEQHLLLDRLKELGFKQTASAFLHEARLKALSFTPVTEYNVQTVTERDDDGESRISDTAQPTDSLKRTRTKVHQHQNQQSASAAKQKPSDSSLGFGRTNTSALHKQAGLQDYTIAESRVIKMSANPSEAYCLTWNPKKDWLGCACSDAKVRAAYFGSLPAVPGSDADYKPTTVTMQHKTAKAEQHNDVTALDWHPNGVCLLTGTIDGSVCLWDLNGELVFWSKSHKGPVFSVKWSKEGVHFLTAGVDKKVIVWNGYNCHELYDYVDHSRAILDADWLFDLIFATGGGDGLLFTYHSKTKRPLVRFDAHENAVSSIRWNRSSQILASGSADCKVKLWSLDDKDAARHELTGHTAAVNCVRWSPAASGQVLLASASDDASVLVCDVNAAAYSSSIVHSDVVNCVNFSPDAKLVATGSLDKSIYVHDTRDNRLVHAYIADASVNDVSWNSRGDLLAACTSKGTVYMFDLRLPAFDDASPAEISLDRSAKKSKFAD